MWKQGEGGVNEGLRGNVRRSINKTRESPKFHLLGDAAIANLDTTKDNLKDLRRRNAQFYTGFLQS